ncbi:HalD/BesD family halogenase [Rhodovibrionaceae bacterium A322]
MKHLINLEKYPLDQPDSPEYAALVAAGQAALAKDGIFNLEDFVQAAAVKDMLAGIKPELAEASFHHKRQHNIYFKPQVDGLPDDHPALELCDTSNHTVCADQIASNGIMAVYDWPPLADFVAAVMQKPVLYVMEDPLARLNILEYRNGERLNWHFDRSEFTVTVLLQTPDSGGSFCYRQNLRSSEDPNYDGVARLMRGEDDDVQELNLASGTLNIFMGVNTAHRITAVEGDRSRIVAVFSYYDEPGRLFTEEERLGFFGRRS